MRLSDQYVLAFHKHLDECPRCESSPFNLCPKGIELISGIINAEWKPAPKTTCTHLRENGESALRFRGASESEKFYVCSECGAEVEV